MQVTDLIIIVPPYGLGTILGSEDSEMKRSQCSLKKNGVNGGRQGSHSFPLNCSVFMEISYFSSKYTVTKTSFLLCVVG